MRLIDADELLERIAEIKNPDMLTIGKVVGTIDTQPTAYDIDKVVEELDKQADHYECEEQGREDVYMIDLSKAIDIVEQGVRQI